MCLNGKLEHLPDSGPYIFFRHSIGSQLGFKRSENQIGDDLYEVIPASTVIKAWKSRHFWPSSSDLDRYPEFFIDQYLLVDLQKLPGQPL